MWTIKEIRVEDKLKFADIIAIHTGAGVETFRRVEFNFWDRLSYKRLSKKFNRDHEDFIANLSWLNSLEEAYENDLEY